MSTSQMTVLKIAGVAGREVMAKMTRWHEAAGPQYWRGYPGRVCDQADRLAAQLLACQVESPVVYRCDWVDGWSIVFPEGPAWGHPQAKKVTGRNHLLWAWQLPDGGELARMAKAQSRRRRFAQESHWLYMQLREAERAWSPLVEDACLLLIQETLGGSWMDEEVAAGLGTGLRSLKGVKGHGHG